jgi:mannose/cellobiose epimerase-like protein (N-acyl-D-glucosamine 2-epimerase family)
VRDISASISASYHIFSAPDAPAPAAMHIIEAIVAQSEIDPGAQTRPAHAVKTTKLMTRGFINAK